MAKSIMQDKAGGECYLCKRLLGIDTPAACREEHHVMHGTANRRLAERYGLKVYLCPWHHRIGPQAPHTCHKIDIFLKQEAQRIFEQKYGHEKWKKEFVRDYLAEERERSQNPITRPPGSPHPAAGQAPAATSKNQQNKPFDQVNISQNTPAGFCFLQDPWKEGI